MTVMFKDDAARDRIRAWYDSFHARIDTPTERRTLSTSFGQTHLLIGGPADAPPVLLLHGALASSAHVLRELEDLMKELRVYAVDVIGQSVMSADARLSAKNDDYGRWLIEVMDQLQLPKAHVIGISWGGFCTLRLAALAPERIDRLALLVPAGLVNGPAWAGLTKMMIPMTLYQLSPSPKRHRAFIENLLTTTDDEWADYIGDAFLSYNFNMQIPMLAKNADLDRLRAPTFIIGADQDLSFPGDALVKRAATLLPNLIEHEVLKDCKHSPPTTPEFRRYLSARLLSFFKRDLSADHN